MVTENSFKQEEEEEVIEPLTMEHFYFPLIFLVVGLLLSTLSFIAEIIINRFQRNNNSRL